MNTINQEVSSFLDELNHPLRKEIDRLRAILLQADVELMENIKWNGPNYCYKGQDRITMKIHPPKQIQLIFHRGAKKQDQPARPLIEDASGLLVWKENDRAVAAFKNMGEIERAVQALERTVKSWILVE